MYTTAGNKGEEGGGQFSGGSNGDFSVHKRPPKRKKKTWLPIFYAFLLLGTFEAQRTCSTLSLYSKSFLLICLFFYSSRNSCGQCERAQKSNKKQNKLEGQDPATATSTWFWLAGLV